ncbi:MAG TPA: sodium:proton antiporter NhaD [Cyclobacteriaceae bacterium]|nr:sodium:proton antiporter NhaD [Cyclobacteriaceae bacterium]
MELQIVIVFIAGYLAIALEHPIKINKTASALLTGVSCWALLALSGEEFQSHLVSLGLFEGGHFSSFITGQLSHHLSNISGILFFLMGAMTIVELIDAHEGFRFITDRITTKNIKVLMWIVSWITFFLSAILDNLTTSIVMVSLIRKIIPHRETRMLFASMIIIAANAGGAWSPIGDVTTTMLWIGGQISTFAIIKGLIGPSIVCLLAPLIVLTFTLKGNLQAAPITENKISSDTDGGKIMLLVGFGALIFVPVYKSITHLPPYMGILLGLGILWVVSEYINPHADEAVRKKYSAAGALSRIDIPSVLFFMGILLAVGALEAMNTLHHFAEYMNQIMGDNRIIISVIGVLSAIVDNVPLVAASMGMYSLETYPADHMIWHYLAYCAGTGGSLLIIGSAAGVAVMGMEQIDFIWYCKKISLLAFIGYAAGCLFYLVF